MINKGTRQGQCSLIVEPLCISVGTDAFLAKALPKHNLVNGKLVQLAEHVTVNHGVESSSLSLPGFFIHSPRTIDEMMYHISG